MTLVAVDNRPLERAQDERLDDVITARFNHGPGVRWLGAMLARDEQYALFYDDDCLPGPCAVEKLEEVAENHEFSTIGVKGRMVREGQYVRKNVRRWDGLRRVDLTCRAHFVEIDRLGGLLDARRVVGATGWGEEGSNRGWWREDDMVLCFGLQMMQGHPSYLLPKVSPECELIRQELPSEGSRCGEPVHGKWRDETIARFVRAGWRSKL